MNGFDVHEVFLTRRDVMGCQDDVRARIHCEENCIAVCQQCHTGSAYITSPEGKKKCADVIVCAIGLPKVVNFLMEIGLITKSNRAEEEIEWLKTNYQN
jgi:hypothetical protein